ncbi:hypothetical protein ACFQX7_27075 [Luedemannella flava]
MVFPANVGDLALACAARVASDDTHFQAIEELGIALIRTVGDAAQWRIGRALFKLPMRRAGLDLNHYAVHPLPAMRAIAAARWARDPGALDVGVALRLAGDEDHRVRKNLALAMNGHLAVVDTNPAITAVVEVLRTDARRSIRGAMSDLEFRLHGREQLLINAATERR